MATKHNRNADNESSSDPHEEASIHVTSDIIVDGDVRQLWSYNSTSGGRYVYITNTTEGSQAYLVAAKGEAEGKTLPSTKIKFHQVDAFPASMFELEFTKNNTLYTVRASESRVIASQEVNGDTIFEVMPLRKPNQPFIALRSNKKNGDHFLYLSSNGAGEMKLKVANQPLADEPAAEVDPSLLFRLVKPITSLA